MTGPRTSQPIGHYEFCAVFPQECDIRMRDRGPEVFDDRLLAMASRINLKVNTAVIAMSDQDIYGRDEVWAYPVEGVGDCEDFVLEKRRLLAREGVSLSNLLITVVRKPDGEGHAVLTLRTDHGDLILDNLSDSILPWQDTDYRYLKRQASTNTGHWVALQDEGTPFVASVNRGY